MGAPLADPQPLHWENEHDHLGWHEQGPDTWFLGLHIPSGRIKDTEDTPLRTGLRDIITQYQPGVRLTPQQNILLTGIRGRDRAGIEGALRCFRLALPARCSPLSGTA